MAIDKLFRTVFTVGEIKVRHDDDFVDRLSRQYTCGLLILCAFIVSTKQFVGDPISCWCPAHFTESHRQYTNMICWISNTYYVPFHHRIPDDHEIDWQQMRMVSYYQWVPLMLLCQAFLSFLPCMLWRLLNHKAGMDIGALMDAAQICQRASYAEIREKTIRYMVNILDRYLLHQRDYRKGCCVRIKQVLSRYCFIVGGKRHGNYLTVTYLIIKLMYTANAVGQLFLMDMFLGIEYHIYGAYVVARLIRGEDWTSSDRFPRVTLCNFEIRHQARVHDYVVQCALTINLFNEKIFIILWFWFVFIAVVTLLSFIKWLFRALYWPSGIHYVKKQLRAFDSTHRAKSTMSKFTQFYLRRDGIFIIRLISINIGEMVAAETVSGLWENYGPERRLISEHPSKSRRSVGNSEMAHTSTAGISMEVV